MSRPTRRLGFFPSPCLPVLGVLLLALPLLPGPASGDDRDLLRRSQQNPYVFILLDISGSMHLSVPCAAEDVAAGDCLVECPSGECLPRAVGDDPDSRLRVAKEAIFEIMEQTDNIHFGFGTFDQDEMRVLNKHWWYRVADASRQSGGLIQLDSGRFYPDAGHEEVFGETWSCTLGFNPNNARDDDVGCGPGDPADLTDPWEAERVRRWPKLDADNDTPLDYYIRDSDGTIYRVGHLPLNTGAFASQQLGDAELTVRVRVQRCDSFNCNSRTTVGDRDLIFEKATEFVHWEASRGVINREAPGVSFFGPGAQQVDIDIPSSDGLESNDDSGIDDWQGHSIKQPTQPDPFRDDFLARFGRTRGAAYSVGDLIPFDWRTGQRQLIRQRMAPNLALPGQTVPDFGIAPYFNDFRGSGEGFLRLADSRARPLVYHGRTPTGKSMEDFRIWFADWLQVATDPVVGDPDLPCRSFHLVVVTDGLATDGVSACGHANELRNFVFNGDAIPVRSFAVALGNPELQIPSRNNVLNCIADNGGTGATDHNGDGEPDGPGPLFPENKQELIDAFLQIFDEITSSNRSFAAAAVPQAQANTADKIFLTSFTPVPAEPLWAGRIDAYVRPVPLTEVQVTADDGSIETRLVPDRSRTCTAPDDAGCRVWDAGEELLALAPDPASLPTPGTALTRTDLGIGTGVAQRRVYFGDDLGPPVPAGRRFFAPPTTDPDWRDLLVGLGICDPADPGFATCIVDPGRRREADDVFRLLFARKTFRNPDTGNDEPYVLGDVFHSNPKVLGAPGNFQLFAGDLFGNGQPCDATGADFNRGYRCFFERHRFRRNVLLVGANDGQLHAFDAGVFRRQGSTTPVQGDFDNGTGRELFSFVPGSVLPTLEALSETPVKHRFSVDGTVVTADVFIDPDHAGVPTESERRWRSVAFGGLREGGSGYFALDLTQPDTVDADRVPEPASGGVLPSCEGGGSGCSGSWPSILWEFLDDEGCNDFAGGRCDDEDNGDGTFGNGRPDLAATWSTPNVGMIEVCDGPTCDGTNVVRKFVAVFGGGLDSERKRDPVQGGNWLYMVDVETGEVLYKQELEGSAPGAPAAVDTDRDGVLDTVYIGTVRGLLYKVDLSTPVPFADDPSDSPDRGKRVTDSRWEPFPIFTTDGRPIFFPPSVIFVAARGQFALAFGTGDREDLWEDAPNDDGRFYLFVDDDFDAGTLGIPFSQSDLRRIDLGAAPVDPDTDFLLSPTSIEPGWFLPLEDDERVITQAFALGGVTVFSSFLPQIETSVLGGDEVVCANRGESRVYVLFTTNGNAVFDNGFRFRAVPDLVTEPFTEVGPIKNAVDSSNGGDPTADDLSDNLREVMETLKSVFPDSCRFANYTINVKALRSDTGVEFIAPVPVCITQRNWKEF